MPQNKAAQLSVFSAVVSVSFEFLNPRHDICLTGEVIEARNRISVLKYDDRSSIHLRSIAPTMIIFVKRRICSPLQRGRELSAC